MPVNRSHVSSAYQASRSYSPIVVTEGGRTIWLAGIVAAEDETGRSLADDFDGQVRCIFRKMSDMLKGVRASLADVVDMKVFITNVSDNTRMVELRKEFFKSDYPASTLVTVAALNRPEYMVEISATAVAA
jgi:enamine deaminase RidA (YjgF/YER057c/UK114 family)